MWEWEVAGQWVGVGEPTTSGTLLQGDRACLGPPTPSHVHHHTWSLTTTTAALSLPSATGTQTHIIFLFLLTRYQVHHLVISSSTGRHAPSN